ncbi:GDP-mannose 4,6-dehydratase [Candidatus Peregrinibacteria bacterium CG22_combo_CG10-13_8_21_14_all_44_10]|nr:MAG: GDP-mannose 4,6-dehydratase [Candidatus Peregrinibacteria bacterium CG2_30_44_17]PIP66438.1 MAG: GDP-mannose 4,6-dehydratase [Candidatus Peregrinibacteria bacterium CG22_combo_CG10-13_8_21_14_all_44_10]PJB89469.1 MAG: GDP-mannose 4,6-dehydratase [Candidatus Peregrinibacteria bacterium CG_4_9_14_0_8_um_filter_44_15]
MSKALITGITGQDGSYLAELLIEKGYEVYGLVRRCSTPNYGRIRHIMDRITLLDGDLLDTSSLIRIIKKVHPDEIYNLAAQSFVAASFSQPILTGETTALGALRLLEATRLVDKGIKFYQASSSEMFGKVRETPQTEQTPFHPRSPYGVAKTFAHYSGMNYRESYDMFVCGGILFNHESPRRGLEFVTRKISDGVARIKLGLSDKINLGNLDAKRDWGFAGDYVKAMWMMMQQDRPDDYIIATGETHSVGEFAKEAFKVIGVNDWENYVGRDEAYMRPAEVDYLIGDYSKAKNQLGWEPEMRFEQLVSTMVEADIKLLSSKKECPTEY